MVSKLLIAAVLVTALVGSAGLLYNSYKEQRSLEEQKLAELELAYTTSTVKGEELITLQVQRYTDVTYLTLSLVLRNNGAEKIRLRRPRLTFYLQGLPAVERELEDLEVPGGGFVKLPLKDLSFSSELVTEALKRKESAASDVLELKATLSTEHELKIRNTTIYRFRLSNNATGKVPIREVFGGKTKEEAVEEILGFTNATFL